MNITRGTQNNILAIRILLILGLVIVCSQRVLETILAFLIDYPGHPIIVDVVLYTVGITLLVVTLIIFIISRKGAYIVKPILAIICLILSAITMIYFTYAYYPPVYTYYLGFIIFGLFLTLFFLFVSLYMNQIKSKATWKTPLFISTILLFIINAGQLINYIIISATPLELWPYSWPSKVILSTCIIAGFFSLISIVAFIGLFVEIMKSFRDKEEREIVEESKPIEQELRVIQQKANTTLIIASILLLIYQIGYTMTPGFNISYLQDGQSEWDIFFIMSFKIYSVVIPASVLIIASMIQLWLGLRKITNKNKKNPKITTAKILAILLMLNPILLDTILMASIMDTPYMRSYLLTGVYSDIIFIVNGLIFIALIILLVIIQRESSIGVKVKIKDLIGSILLIGSFIAWIIVVIYKLLKLYPIPGTVFRYDYYFNELRIVSNWMHIVFGICGFISILELLIKSIINRKKLYINS
jgi:MFS family permease